MTRDELIVIYNKLAPYQKDEIDRLAFMIEYEREKTKLAA